MAWMAVIRAKIRQLLEGESRPCCDDECVGGRLDDHGPS